MAAADSEPATARQPDHVAMAVVELDRVAAQPLGTLYAEAGPPPGSGRKGSHRMLASYSEITRSRAASASGICSALAWSCRGCGQPVHKSACIKQVSTCSVHVSARCVAPDVIDNQEKP
jgi:hypothetical protein